LRVLLASGNNWACCVGSGLQSGHDERAATAVMRSPAEAERGDKGHINPIRPSTTVCSCAGIVTAARVPTAIARRLNSYRTRPSPRRSSWSCARCTSEHLQPAGVLSS